MSFYFPVASSNNRIEGDTSLMTYRGHSVLQTLIRCHFSPSFSTGQRYIYTGCAAGRVVSKDKNLNLDFAYFYYYFFPLLIISVYDVLTGKIEKVLLGHTACVRDVSWHPYLMEIIDSAVSLKFY